MARIHPGSEWRFTFANERGQKKRPATALISAAASSKAGDVANPGSEGLAGRSNIRPGVVSCQIVAGRIKARA